MTPDEVVIPVTGLEVKSWYWSRLTSNEWRVFIATPEYIPALRKIQKTFYRGKAEEGFEMATSDFFVIACCHKRWLSRARLAAFLGKYNAQPATPDAYDRNPMVFALNEEKGRELEDWFRANFETKEPPGEVPPSGGMTGH